MAEDEKVRGTAVTDSSTSESDDQEGGGSLLTMIVALVAMAIAAGLTDDNTQR
jgi:hypothetical protein